MMRMVLTVGLIVGLGVLAVPAAARAQAGGLTRQPMGNVAPAVTFVPDLTPGTRVRVRTEAVRGKQVGSVVSVDSSVLIMNVPGLAVPARVRLDAISRLKVSDGRHSRGRNALIGVGLGSAIGTGVMAALLASTGGSDDTGAILLVGVVLGAPIGALTGAAVSPSDRWREVPLGRSGATARSTGLSVRPVRGHGVAASMSMTF